MNTDPVRIAAATDMDAVRTLFTEYQQFLDVDLCFQDFDEELADLPGKYTPPSGAILFGWRGEALAGCVAMRPLTADTCEMKRLYVRDDHRGHGIGARLARASMEAARQAGYRRMCLDTLPKLATAIGMYERMGFRRIAPYYHNPLPGVLYLECTLAPSTSPGVARR